MTRLENAIDNARDLRPRTKQLYLQHVRAFQAFCGDDPPKTWSAERVEAWRADMLQRKIKPQSVNVALNALRFAAQQASLTFVNEVKASPTPAKTDKVDVAPLTRTEGVKLVKVCEGVTGRDLRDRAIILLGLRTGMLRFSMCALRCKDFEQPTRTYRGVPTTANNLAARAKLTFVKKGGDAYTMALDDETYDALNAWHGWLTANVKVRPNDALFRSLGRERVSGNDAATIGAKLTPDGLYRALQQRAARVDLKDLSPYVFRRTFIAWAQVAKAQPLQIAVVTGLQSDAAGEEADPDAFIVPANFLIRDLT